MPAPDDWRATLDALLASPDATEPPAFVPLGLTFELRTLLARTAHRWNGPVSRRAGPVPSAGLDHTHRLGVRPVVRSAKGWSRTGLTWSTLSHGPGRRRLDPEQHRWCAEFGALYRAVTPISGRDPDWVFLDDFANPALWTLLDQAAGLGVELVAAGAGQPIGRATGAELTLDAAAEPAGIRLRPRLLVDGDVRPAHRARPIAGHGLYLIDPDGLPVLVPVPLAAEQRAALGAQPDPVVVPTPALPAFLTDYLPRLRERITVASADDSVPLPAPAPPVLVLTATHRPGHQLTLTWAWTTSPTIARPPLSDLLAGLVPADWILDGAELPVEVTLSGLDAAEFATDHLPRLQARPGVRVQEHGQAPAYRELTAEPELAVTVLPSEKPDWFTLGITVTVNGHEVPFHPLFTALARGRHKLLLTDGSFLSLKQPSLRRLTELIDASAHLDEWQPLLPISRHRLASLRLDQPDLTEHSPDTRRWRALVADAARETAVHVPPSPRLRATLRPYQQAGLDWLAFLWRHRLGGILADDMGLGKTLQCLALVQHAADDGEQRPFLVVAPTSVGPNWITEAARFTPELTARAVTTTQGSGPIPLAEQIVGSRLVVTSYALLRLDADAYRDIDWAALVLDEAQFVKNPAAQVHQVAADLPVQMKLAVTGTPLENSLADLHALCAIVAPGLFPSAARFARDFIRPIEGPMTGIARGVGAGSAPQVRARVRTERLAEVRRRIRPFLLRRNKSDVAPELPPRLEQVLRVDLEPAHRELYDTYLQRERRKVLRVLDEDDPNHRFIVFRSLTLLRLLALDPGLIDEDHHAVPAAKLDLLVRRLADVRAEGHRALVFSQFTLYLGKVRERLDRAGITYAYLDGSTRNRSAVVEEFRTGAAPVFLISLKAGGFGLNLTEADYVFLLDPWWNPTTEQQAIDRTHRIGQDRTVVVYRLVAADTIEEKVMALQQRKADLFDAVVDGDDFSGGRLSPEDLRGLFG